MKTKGTWIGCLLVAGIGLFLVGGCAGSRGGVGKTADAGVRVGTYDSRSVAIAWVGTESFKGWMAELREDHAAAVAAGDTQRAETLAAEGEERQEQLHRQGFGTAPVDTILAGIEEKLEKIKTDAGVVALVSRWDKEALAEYENATQVDLTEAVVDALGPTQKQRESALSIRTQDPISDADLNAHGH